MKIAIFGLGYVGCVSVACLADFGHEVTGTDINHTKVDLLNKGIATIIEKDIDKLVSKGWKSGRIMATNDYIDALRYSDISIICVGTPNGRLGHLDLCYIYRVAENIGDGLKNNNKFHVIIIRSTVLPGTNHRVGSIIEEHAGRKRGDGFEVVSNPEFLREGSAVHDFFNPAYTVIGTSSDRAFAIVKSLYKGVNAPVKRTSIKVAETIKMINNSFHALKVTFANEIGNLCKCLGVDSHEAMALFCEDKQLNLSSYYLKPGFAYGGSCLPKDLSALKLIAHDNYVNTPVIDAIDRSNENQKQMLVDLIVQKGIKKIGILGLSFKRGTDDLRNSPIVEVAEQLLGKGYELKIYDKNVYLSNLTGKNKEYINKHIPHLEELISDTLEAVTDHAELLIVAHNEKEFENLSSRHTGKFVIDLVRIAATTEEANENYEGICW